MGRNARDPGTDYPTVIRTRHHVSVYSLKYIWMHTHIVCANEKRDREKTMKRISRKKQKPKQDAEFVGVVMSGRHREEIRAVTTPTLPAAISLWFLIFYEIGKRACALVHHGGGKRTDERVDRSIGPRTTHSLSYSMARPTYTTKCENKGSRS